MLFTDIENMVHAAMEPQAQPAAEAPLSSQELIDKLAAVVEDDCSSSSRLGVAKLLVALDIFNS